MEKLNCRLGLGEDMIDLPPTKNMLQLYSTGELKKMALQIYTTLGSVPEKIWAVCRVPCWTILLSTFFLQRGFGEDSDFWAIFQF